MKMGIERTFVIEKEKMKFLGQIRRKDGLENVTLMGFTRGTEGNNE